MLAYYGPEWEGLQGRIVGRWTPSFSGPNGLHVPDNTGQNHGVLLGDRNACWQTSDGKTALVFNGTTEHVVAIALNPFGNLATDSLTFNFWSRNPTGTSGTLAGLASSTDSFPFLVFQNFGSSLRLFTRFFGSNDRSITGGTFQSSEWRMITGVLVPNAISLFINGVFTASTTRTVPQATTLNQLTLGALNRAGSLSQYAACQIDDVTIFRDALNPQEINWAYEKGRGGGLLYQPPRRRSVAAIIAALVLACETGNYSLAGQAAGLFASRLLAADQAQYILSGNAANTTASRLLSADPASYTATGNDAATICARLLDGGAAAYALTGTDAGLIANRKLTADQAVYFLAGNNAELLRSLKLNAGSMALQLDNFAASLLADRKISADGAQYLLVVSDANLGDSASGVAPYYYLFMLRGPQ